MKKLMLTLALAASALLATPALASAGVSGPAFYVDGEFYRTVGTPTDLSGTGAPAHSFDTIYAIAGQPNVATAAPGDPGFNGGRWMVHALDIADYDAALAVADTNGSGDLDSYSEVLVALDAGLASDGGVIRSFECPVIPLPRR